MKLALDLPGSAGEHVEQPAPRPRRSDPSPAAGGTPSRVAPPARAPGRAGGRHAQAEVLGEARQALASPHGLHGDVVSPGRGRPSPGSAARPVPRRAAPASAHGARPARCSRRVRAAPPTPREDRESAGRRMDRRRRARACRRRRSGCPREASHARVVLFPPSRSASTPQTSVPIANAPGVEALAAEPACGDGGDRRQPGMGELVRRHRLGRDELRPRLGAVEEAAPARAKRDLGPVFAEPVSSRDRPCQSCSRSRTAANPGCAATEERRGRVDSVEGESVRAERCRLPSTPSANSSRAASCPGECAPYTAVSMRGS